MNEDPNLFVKCIILIILYSLARNFSLEEEAAKFLLSCKFQAF